uniref:Uncharacterized protein n=1 Tax=Anguilla anguilla TaxID=7936 RepID=A0A0E9WJE9_ANGAN
MHKRFCQQTYYSRRRFLLRVVFCEKDE